MRSRQPLGTAVLVTCLICFGRQAAAPATAQHEPTLEMTAGELVKMADEVEREVAELRGWKFKRPVKKDVRTEAELRTFIEKKLFEEELGGGKLTCLQELLRTVGLIPETCDLERTYTDVLLNQIGGFYDPDSGAFYLLQRGGVHYGPLVNRILVAHELTHALDDQYVDLNTLLKSGGQTEDANFAIAAVVEGSATALMTRYLTQAVRTGKYDPAELQQVAQSEMQRSKAFLEAPAYFTTLMANYLCGMNFLLRGQITALAVAKTEQGVGRDFLAAAKDPPRSSEQILHPEKYWNAAHRDEPVVVSDEEIERLLAGSGRCVVYKDTLGELLCGILTNPADQKLDVNLAISPDYWTTDAAEGWGGDRFFLLAAEKKPDAAKTPLSDVRGVWITAWDTRTDRGEFVTDYNDQRVLSRRRHFLLSDRVAVFLFGFDADEAAELEHRFAESPPTFRCAGRHWAP